MDQGGKELLLETETIITNANYNYPDLIPITALNEPDNYYYVITYLISTENSCKQELIFCKINTKTKLNNPIKSLTVNELKDEKFGPDAKYNFLNKGLSCEYMHSFNTKEFYDYLACFFIIIDTT